MMYKEQIEEQINRIRKHMRTLKHIYNVYPNERTYDDLMFYKAKIDSWKRIQKRAPRMMTLNLFGEPAPFQPDKKYRTLEEILADANIPTHTDKEK